MLQGRTVFSQFLDFMPKHEFNKCVERYQGDHRSRKLSCLDQFLAMVFAQLTYRESLRDIETCLLVLQSKLYHAGFRGTISRSTLADANEHRDWRIYADFAQILITHARSLYAQDSFAVALAHAAYAFDSTTIALCLKLFPWASFRRHKGAVKMHTQLDLRGNIPCFIRITHGKVHDVKALDHLSLEAGAFYMLDRGYTDFKRLHTFTKASAFFIIPAKKKLDFGRRSYRKVDKSTGLRSDVTIGLQGVKTSVDYPEGLRRISYFDVKRDKRLIFLSNNFLLPALTITELYKCRWQVELFFKWIKQHLRIKVFFGHSPNAVKTQIWIAISTYLMMAILNKELKLERPMHEISQILSIALFEKSPLFSLFQPLSAPKAQKPEK